MKGIFDDKNLHSRPYKTLAPVIAVVHMLSRNDRVYTPHSRSKEQLREKSMRNEHRTEIVIVYRFQK